MEVLNLEQGSQDWLDARKKYVGASEVSYLFNANPFCKETDQMKYLIGIKLGFVQVFQNNAMKMGNIKEDDIIKTVEFLKDIHTTKQVAAKGLLLASFDGITDDFKTIIEVKHSKHTYNELKDKNVPFNYYLQVQQQLMVSGADMCYFAAMNPDTDDVEILEIYPELEIFDDIERKLNEFIEYRSSKKWAEDDFQKERTDSTFEILVSDYKEVSNQIDELQKRQSEIKEALICEANGEKTKGFGLTVYPTAGRKTINYNQIVKDMNIEYDEDKYTTIGKTSWAIRVGK